MTAYIVPTVRKQGEDAGAQLSVTLVRGLGLPTFRVSLTSCTSPCRNLFIDTEVCFCGDSSQTDS